MIETLYGKIFEVSAAACAVILECGGVGYRVAVTANTLSTLPSPRFAPDGTTIDAEAPTVRIYTHMAVREDAVELFGFATREELDTFRLLIGVSGIGPKAGMSILSLLTPKKLASAVASGDAKTIARAPGVGPKTAARVVMELKDKLAKLYPAGVRDEGGKPAAPLSDGMADARDALAALGYSRSEIAAAMKHVDPASDAETIIKSALAVLMKN